MYVRKATGKAWLMIPLIIGLCLICLGSCIHFKEDAVSTRKSKSPSETFAKERDSIPTSALSTNSSELQGIYIQAIRDFIKTAYKQHATIFDTLYFGKHVHGQPDDFPDIILPNELEHTVLRLISPELGEKLQKERKERVYINLFGFIEKEHAEFVFVVFKHGFNHQYDYTIKYRKNPSTSDFVIENIEYMNFAQTK
ncbi:MAG: hypothetical protein JNM95_14475 [Chitinophagaceae bacterium]|nr:hypothetical protein [Chitinophagaceae bacterium]